MVGAFLSILLLMVARHHPPSRRKIKEIWHGRVYWERESNTTMLRSSLRVINTTVDTTADTADTTTDTVDTTADTAADPSTKREMQVMVSVLSRRSAFETRQVIRETWASGHNNVFFVVGVCCPIPPNDRKKWTCKRAKPTSVEEQSKWDMKCAKQDLKIAEEESKYKDIIRMPDIDVYRHLPQKVKFGYKWGLEHTTAKWFVKTDDDSVVRIDTLGSYLQKTYNSDEYVVVGRIANGWGVPRSGKWAENNYKPSKYPKFPLGSVGHVVSKGVATYIVDNSDKLFNYQGEDVSIGIWLNESPLKSEVKWVTSKHMANHGNCKDTGMWVMGHNIKPAKMRECFAHNDEINSSLKSTEKIQIKNISPFSLDLDKRFDIIVKSVYAAEWLEKGTVSVFTTNMYNKHLKVWNNFQEPCKFRGQKDWFDASKPCVKKASAQDFTTSFQKTIQSLKETGFDNSKSIVPVTNSLFPLNGAHRIAAAIALGMDKMPVQLTSSKHAFHWNANFFIKKGFDTVNADFAMLQFLIRSPQVATLLFWPEAASHENMVSAQKMVRDKLPVLYSKQILLNKKGVASLTEHAYGQQNWLSAKIKMLQTTFNDGVTKKPLMVMFAITKPKPEMDAFKLQLRKHFNLNELKSSVHISDFHAEANIIGEMVLNDNSVMFMNRHKGQNCKEVSHEIAVRKSLKEAVPGVYLHTQDIMVDSGAVMSFFGLRKRTDIDILFQNKIDKSFLGWKNNILIEAHAFDKNKLGNERAWGQEHITPTRSVNDLFTDPQNYGYCHGIKFVSLQQLVRYKTLRGEPNKDDKDVAQIKTFLEDSGTGQTDFDIPDITIPPGITKIYIDVGTHFMTEFRQQIINDPTLFVIGIEPTPKTFKSAVQSWSHPRLIMINAAITLTKSKMPFYVNVEGAHCNSILKRNSKFLSPILNGKKTVVHCPKKGTPVMVQTFPLDDIISQVPFVTYLKIDAQGYDYEVIKSSTKTLSKIKKIKLECQDVGSKKELLLYEKAVQCPEIQDWVVSNGFELKSKSYSNSNIKEYDMEFESVTQSTTVLTNSIRRKLSMDDDTFMGVRAKPFGNDEQKALYRLLRLLYKNKMYPLDVKSPAGFHTKANWGGHRGNLPIGRYYLHKWLDNMNSKISGPKKCLEIGDGHYIKNNGHTAWRQKKGKMLSFCSEDSISLDLVDPRADLHANLERPFKTLKEHHRLNELKDGFDVIICAQVFEHIDNPRPAIIGISKLLKPGGTLLFSVPFISNPVHGHDVHRFTTTGVANLAKHADLQVISNEAMGNSLVTVGYLLDLSSDDFTEKELMQKDPHQYVGVYSMLQKPKKTPKPKINAIIFVLSHSSRSKSGVTGLERRNSIRETWKNDVPNDSIFRFVMDKTSSLEILNEAKTYGDIMFLGTEQKGQAKEFGKKLMEMSKWALQNYDFKYMFRVDDDNFLCIEHIFHDLKTLQYPESIVWGWWFSTPMLMNPPLDTFSMDSPNIGNVCSGYSGTINAKKKWRPDEMLIIISANLVEEMFGGTKLPQTWDLMDVTIIQLLKNTKITYMVDNARIQRGIGTYGPNAGPNNIQSYCKTNIAYHKAHPEMIKKLWKSGYEDYNNYNTVKIHKNCIKN